MCTAVDGGSIHRAARRISAASHQTSTTPITSHRTKDRRKPLRSGVLGGVSGFSVTFQNTSLWLGCRLCLVLRAPLHHLLHLFQKHCPARLLRVPLESRHHPQGPLLAERVHAASHLSLVPVDKE